MKRILEKRNKKLILILGILILIPRITLAVTLNLQVNTSLGDTSMGSITDNSGRNVTQTSFIDNSTYLEPGSHGSNSETSSALRFTSVTIPQGTTITNATLSLRPVTYCPVGKTIKFHVSTQASDNAAALTTTNGDLNITNRPRSTADAGPWNQSCINSSTLETLDVTNIVQEVINRAGWVSGNAIVILIDTHADTDVTEWQDYESYNTTPSEAARLDITYGGGTTIPKVKIRSGIRVRGIVKFR